jgi:hypothetical protein
MRASFSSNLIMAEYARFDCQHGFYPFRLLSAVGQHTGMQRSNHEQKSIDIVRVHTEAQIQRIENELYVQSCSARKSC